MINKTPYEILLNQINNANYKDKTKQEYIYIINRLNQYDKTLDDIKNLLKFIKENYTLNSSIKIINLIANYFKNIDEIKYNFFNNERNKIKEEIYKQDKSKVFKGNGINDYNKILDTLENNNWKLIFLLLINYPNLRISDYYSIKINPIDKKKDNYFTKNFTKIIFKHLVKENKNNKNNISIKLKPEHKKLFKEILTNYEYNNLNLNLNIGSFKKQLNRLSKKYFSISPSDFRKLIYKENVPSGFKEIYNKLEKIANNQNHNLKTSLQYYI